MIIGFYIDIFSYTSVLALDIKIGRAGSNSSQKILLSTEKLGADVWKLQLSAAGGRHEAVEY